VHGFLIQPRTSSSMDVEDSRIEWNEAQAPFYRVATIHIPAQVFDTPAQSEFCENFHSLPGMQCLSTSRSVSPIGCARSFMTISVA